MTATHEAFGVFPFLASGKVDGSMSNMASMRFLAMSAADLITAAMSHSAEPAGLFLPESGHPFVEARFADLIQLAPFPDRRARIQAPLHAARPHAPSLPVFQSSHPGILIGLALDKVV